MKPNTFVLAAALLACGFAANAAPVVRAQSVPSERSKAAPVVATPRWKAEAFPASMATRLQYDEMSAARILQVQRNNESRGMKPTQIGIARVASSESMLRTLPALSWIAADDGGLVARIEIHSPIALGLRVGLKVDGLDPRAELRFSGSDEPSRIVAMMTGTEIRKLATVGNLFWTPATDGEKQLIEVYLPAGVPRAGTRLQAPQLSHLLTSSAHDFKIIPKIGESGSCNVDTACRVPGGPGAGPNGPVLDANFVSAKNAVAHMLFTYNNGTSFICTGTLLADTVTTSQIPYFYSANHCFAGGGTQPVQDLQTVSNTLNTFWKYEATACGSGVQAAKVQLTGGSDHLYSDPDLPPPEAPGTDAMLLRLKNAPPAGSEFSGWDSAVLPASSNIIGIHHPSGDAKKVSSGQQVPANSDALQNSVGWLSGTTEGGSSGSGLFTTSATGYKLRGGLFGGSASCDNDGALGNAGNRDYYSRFDVVFPNIAQYLAPVPANVAPVANFTSSVSGQVVTFTNTSTDADGTIASRSWNFGDGTTSTTNSPVKTYASFGTYNVSLTVTDNGGLSHTLTRSVVIAGRTRLNDSQPRVPRRPASSAPAALPQGKQTPIRKADAAVRSQR